MVFTSVIAVIMIKPVFQKLLIELSLVLGVQGEGEAIASHCGPAPHLRSSITLFVSLSTRLMLIGPKEGLENNHPWLEDNHLGWKQPP